MGFDHRKLLLVDVDDHKKSFCSLAVNGNGKGSPRPHSRPPCPPQPPPPPPPPSPLLQHHGGGDVSMKELATLGMTILACVIAGVLLLGILCAIVRAYHLRRRSRENRRIPPIFFGTQEDFLDEDHGPEVDHPIWYINTVGLPQSVIDSISVFLYRKGEGLIDGTECSVCLNEFQEDERLRLLPKCSHAFHIACIDAWLRSHKNCPLCRAPTVIDLVVAQTSELQPSSSGVSDPRNENSGENLRSYSGEASASVGENGTSEIITNGNGIDSNATLPFEDVSASENSGKFLPHLKTRNGDSDSRVLSDLADNRRVIEEDLEPVRRSVSMDSSSASKIYVAVASVVNDKSQVNLDIIQQVHCKNLKAKSVSKRIGGSSSIYRLINSSSNGSSLQKGPISMKRSVSSSGKSSSSRHNRRQPILPVSF